MILKAQFLARLIFLSSKRFTNKSFMFSEVECLPDGYRLFTTPCGIRAKTFPPPSDHREDAPLFRDFEF